MEEFVLVDEQQKNALEIPKQKLLDQNLQKITYEEEQKRFRERNGTSRILGDAAMRHNKASLGSKVRFKPNEEEKRQNQKIDDSRKLTKKATAYTYDLYTVLNEKLTNGKIIDPSKREDDKVEEQLAALSRVSFTAKMFNGKYILNHFSRLYDLVAMYKNLETVRGQNGNIMTRDQIERFRKLQPFMDLLTKRLNYFAKENRLKLESYDGKLQVMGENESVQDYERITAEDRRQWMMLTSGEKARRKEERRLGILEKKNPNLTEDYMEQQYRDGSKEFSDEEIEELKGENYSWQDLPDYLSMTIEDRIKNLPEINKQIAALGNQLLSEELENDAAIEIRKVLSELDLVRKLTLLEIRIYARHEKNDELLLEYYEDLRQLRKRKEREGEPLILPEVTLPPGYHKLTREEVLDNASDNASYESRTALLKKGEDWWKTVTEKGKLDAPAEAKGRALIIALRSYFDGNQYVVGHKEEEDRMKKVRGLLSEIATDPAMAFLSDNEAFRDFLQGVNQLCDGGLDTSAAYLPGHQGEAGYEIIRHDFSSEDPKDEGEFKKSVSFRDGAMHNPVMRKNESRRNDPLFAHEPTINDLRQGKISNCWMVGALTSMINRDPSIIKNCMKDNGNGTVTVRLYDRKQERVEGHLEYTAWPMFVTVKKVAPRLRTGGAILTDGPLWVSILERAMAHIGRNDQGEEKRGYRALWYGKPWEMIFALTGKQSESVGSMGAVQLGVELNGETSADPVKQKENLFREIMNANKGGPIFNYASLKEGNVEGMNTGHIYTVIGAKMIGNQKYITLRNPYGNMNLEYDKSGKISRSDSYLSSTMNESCGQFDVKYEDFLRNMAALFRSDMKADVIYQKNKPTAESTIHRPNQV